MALLPPRPNVKEALKILGLSESKDGIKQLFQHIYYDELPAYCLCMTWGIRTDDSRIKVEKDFFGGDSVFIDAEKIELRLDEKGVFNFFTVVRMLDFSYIDESAFQLERFAIDDDEYYSIDVETDGDGNVTIARLESSRELISNIFFKREDLLNLKERLALNLLASKPLNTANIKPSTNKLGIGKTNQAAAEMNARSIKQDGEPIKYQDTPQALPPYLDKTNPNYAHELALAITAWQAVNDMHDPTKTSPTFRSRVAEWLENNGVKVRKDVSNPGYETNNLTSTASNIMAVTNPRRKKIEDK